MRVRSIHLRNFKRFTDTLVRDIPAKAKLVVVVGPNGCGKSSLFDALLHWYRSTVGFGRMDDELYFRKRQDRPFEWNKTVEVVLHDNQTPKKGSLYVRTAYRNDPDFSVNSIKRAAIPSEQVRFGRVIENDQTVSANYQRLVYDTTANVYDSANDGKPVEELREELIGGVQSSMERVFGDLVLKSIQDPLGSGAFFFEKGEATSYHYKNLSGGEKAAFDLLLDLHIKKKYFPDAIYCIDEVDSHLHTRIQGALVRELVKIVPGESQLWVTTHSLGVLRTAQEMEVASPGSVCILDFEGVEPDVPTELQPVTLGRVAWEKLLSIALDDLSERIAPARIVVCEGSSIGNRRRDFDAEIYNRILGRHLTDTVFISGGSAQEAPIAGVSIREALGRILPSTQILCLIDRDDRSPAEVADLEAQGTIVLSQRNLESYLFADDVIEALAASVGKQELLGDALKMKADALSDSVTRGHASDDLKSAAGNIYNQLKAVFELQRCGNNTEAFMRDTLAPLIVPGMQTYEKLREDVLGRLS
jgi:predicted ATPase